jgi:hypothetical protein
MDEEDEPAKAEEGDEPGCEGVEALGVRWPRANPTGTTGGITERAERDNAARDEGERTCYHIATSTEHLTISSANP